MWAQGILQGLLGELVHLPKQELKFDVLNGHVLLGNLSVQPKALQLLLDLPLVVQAGVIGRVELHIPWSKLGTEPTRVLLDRVLLLVTPRSAAQLELDDEKAATERKLVRLKGHRERNWGGVSAPAQPQPTPSRRGSRFFSSLTGKLVKNLQVDLSNIIIRYCDPSHGLHPYSISIALDSLRLRKHEHGDQVASLGAGAFGADSVRLDGTASTGSSRPTPPTLAETKPRYSSGDSLSSELHSQFLVGNAGDTEMARTPRPRLRRRSRDDMAGILKADRLSAVPPSPGDEQTWSSKGAASAHPPLLRSRSEGMLSSSNLHAHVGQKSAHVLAKVVHMTGLSVCASEGVAPEPPPRWRRGQQASARASMVGSEARPSMLGAMRRVSSYDSTDDMPKGGERLERTASALPPNTPKKVIAELLLWLVLHVDEWHHRVATGPGLILEPLSATLELRASGTDTDGATVSGAGGDAAPSTPSRNPGRRAAAPGLQLSQLRLFDASLVSTRAQMRLTAAAIGQLTACIDYLSHPTRFEVWRRFRPEERETPLSHPRLWCQRAIAAVRAEVARLRPRCSWEVMAGRREERRKYVALYIRTLRAARTGGRLGDADKASLLAMERVLSYEQVVFYRSLAEAHAKVEADRGSLFISPERKHKLVEATRAAGGAIRRLFGMAAEEEPLGVEATDVLEGRTLSNQQREVLANILRDWEVGEAPPAARDVRATLQVSIPEARILLTDDAPPPPSTPSPPHKAVRTPATPADVAQPCNTADATGSPSGETMHRPLKLRLVLQSIEVSTVLEDGLPSTTVTLENAQLVDFSTTTRFPSVLMLQRDLHLTRAYSAKTSRLSHQNSSCDMMAQVPRTPMFADEVSENSRHALSDSEEHSNRESSVGRVRNTPSLTRRSGRAAFEEARNMPTQTPTRLSPTFGSTGTPVTSVRVDAPKGHHRRRSAAIGETLHAHRRPALSIRVCARDAHVDATVPSVNTEVHVSLAPVLVTVTYGVLEGLYRLFALIPPPRPGVARIVDQMIQPKWRPVGIHANWREELVEHMESVEPTAPDSENRMSIQLHLPSLRLTLPLKDTDAETRQMILALDGVQLHGGSYASISQPSDYRSTIDKIAVDIKMEHSTIPLLDSTTCKCRITNLVTASPGFSNPRTLVHLTPIAIISTFTPAVVGTLMGFVNEWAGPSTGYARRPPTPNRQSAPVGMFSFRVRAPVFELILQHEAAEPPAHFRPATPPVAHPASNSGEPKSIRAAAVGGAAGETPLVIGRVRIGAPSLDIHADSSLRLNLDASSFEIVAEGVAAARKATDHYLNRVASFKPSLSSHRREAPPPPLYHQPGGEQHTEARKLASVRRRRHTDSVGCSRPVDLTSGSSSSSLSFEEARHGTSERIGSPLPQHIRSPSGTCGSDVSGLDAPTCAPPVDSIPVPDVRSTTSPSVLQMPPPPPMQEPQVATPSCRRTGSVALRRHSHAQQGRESSLSQPPLALRMRLVHNMSVPLEAACVKSVTLELGEGSLIWDTASAQLFLRHLYLACRDAFPPRKPRPYYLRGFQPLPHDAWNARIICPAIRWRFLDSLASTPCLVGILHLRAFNVFVRLTAACTTDVSVSTDLTSIDLPPNACLSLSPLESLPADSFDARVASLLTRLREPLDTMPGAPCPMHMRMTTYNELSTPRASELQGRTMHTRISYAASRVHYHHAAVMRLHDFLTGAVIGAASEASVPYLGSDPGLSSLEQHFDATEIRVPAASDATLPAPEVRLMFSSIAIRKQQPNELPKDMTGTTIELSNMSVSAPCAENETNPTDYEAGVGVSELDQQRSVWKVPTLRLRMIYPQFPGHGLEQGVPESLMHVEAGRMCELNFTPYQLAVLAAVKDYNLATPPMYVMPSRVLPPATVQLGVRFVAEKIKLNFWGKVESDEPPALTIELRDVDHCIDWGVDLSTAAKASVGRLFAYAEPLGNFPFFDMRPLVEPKPPLGEESPGETLKQGSLVEGTDHSMPGTPPDVAIPETIFETEQTALLAPGSASHTSEVTNASASLAEISQGSKDGSTSGPSTLLGRRLSFLRHRDSPGVERPRESWLRIPSFFNTPSMLQSMSTVGHVETGSTGLQAPNPLEHHHEGGASPVRLGDGTSAQDHHLRRGSSTLSLIRRRRTSKAFRTTPCVDDGALVQPEATAEEAVTLSHSRQPLKSSLSLKRKPSVVRIQVPDQDDMGRVEQISGPDLPSPITESSGGYTSPAPAISLSYTVSAAPESVPTVDMEMAHINVLLLPNAVVRLALFARAAATFFERCYARPLPTPVVTLAPYQIKLNVEDLHVWLPVVQPTPTSSASDHVQALMCRSGLRFESNTTQEQQVFLSILHRQTGLHGLSVARRSVLAHFSDGLAVIERFMMQAQYNNDATAKLVCQDPLRVHVDAYHLRMVVEAVSDFRTVLTAALPAAQVFSEEGTDISGWAELRPDELRGWGSSALAERIQRDSVTRRDRHASACVRPSSTSARSPGSPNLASRSFEGPNGRNGAPSPPRWYRVRIEINEISVLFVSSVRITPTPTLQILVSKLVFGLDTSSGTSTLGPLSNVQLDLCFQVDYFNRNIAEWEPVLEQAPFFLELEVDGRVFCKVRFAQVLEFVLSNHSIHALNGYAKRVQRTMSSPLHMVTSREARAPYRLRNEAGVPLRYGGGGAATVTHLLHSGHEEDVQIWKDGAVQDHAVRSVALEVCEMRTTRRVAIDHAGTRIVPLRADVVGGQAGGSSAHPLALCCAVEVCDDGFTTLLRVQSLVQVRNETGVPLELRVRLLAKAGTERAEHSEDIGSVAVGASLPIPVDMLHGGLIVRPLSHGDAYGSSSSPPSQRGPGASVLYDWPQPGSTIWLARTITASRSRQYQRASARARRLFHLEDSDYLLDHFRCQARTGGATNLRRGRLKWKTLVRRRRHTSSTGERIGGLLYLTSSSICFYSRSARMRQIVPVSSVTALEWSGHGHDIVLRWKASQKRTVGDTVVEESSSVKGTPRLLSLLSARGFGRNFNQISRLAERTYAAAQSQPLDHEPELELRLCPTRHRQKVYDGLEKTVSRHVPNAVKSTSTEELRRRFGLPASVRLICSFSCSYEPSTSKKIFFGGYRGELYLFSSHVCFYGRSLDGKEATRVILLEHLVSLERKLGSWGLGRLSSALVISTLDEEHLFSAFWRPLTTLKALIEAWEHAQELADERTGDADIGNPYGTGGEATDLQEEDFVALRLPQVVVCSPVTLLEQSSLGQSTVGSNFGGDVSDISSLGLAGLPVASQLEQTPFYCCVRVARQQLPSSGRAGKQHIQSVAISLHTPLTLHSALPFPIRWILLSPNQAPAAGLRGLRQKGYFSHMSRIGHRRSVLRSGVTRQSERASDYSVGDSLRYSTASRLSHRVTNGLRGGSENSLGFEEVASGIVDAFGVIHCHAIDPNQHWQLVIAADGFEPTAPFWIHRGLSGDSQTGKLPDVVEMEHLANSSQCEPSSSKGPHGQSPSPKRGRMSIHLDNSLLGGGSRKIVLYAPYWLVNKTGLPLLFREVRLGINKGVGAGRSQTMAEASTSRAAVASELASHDSNEEIAGAGVGHSVPNALRPAMPTLSEDDGTLSRNSRSNANACLCSQIFLADRIDDDNRVNMRDDSPRGDPSDTTHESEIGDPADVGFQLFDGEGEVVAEELERLEVRVQPQLFSFSRKDRFASRISVKVSDGASQRSWSKPVSIEAVDTRYRLRCGSIELGLLVARAPGSAGDYSNEVTFAPRYVIRSELPVTLRYRQARFPDSELVLMPHREASFNWTSRKGELLVELALDSEKFGRSAYSCGFRIDSFDEFVVRCGQPEIELEVVSENQRRHTPISSWSAGNLLPTDRHGAWSDTKLEQRHKGGLAAVEPPPGWEWLDDEWTLDRVPKDPNGWEYASNWPSAGSRVGDAINMAKWHQEVSSVHYVRRRCWYRRRQLKPEFRTALRERLLLVSVKEMGASVLVVISDGALHSAKYAIENATAANVEFQQRGYPAQRTLLPAGEPMNFVWTAVAGPRIVDIWLGESMEHAEVKFDEVGYETKVTWIGIPMSLRVVARGSARILVIAPQIKDVSEIAQPSMDFEAHVHGVGVSLVRSGVEELAYMRFSGLGVLARLSPEAHKFRLAIDNIRLDNQSKGAQLPAVLIRSSYVTRQRNIVGDEVDAREQRRNPSLKLSIERDVRDNSGLKFKQIFLGILEFDLLIEERFVRDMLNFSQLLRADTPMTMHPTSGRAAAQPRTPRRSLAGPSRRNRQATPNRPQLHLRNTSEEVPHSNSEHANLARTSPNGNHTSLPTPRRKLAVEPETREKKPGDGGRTTDEQVYWYVKALEIQQMKLNITYIQSQQPFHALANAVIPNLDRVPLYLERVVLHNEFNKPQQLVHAIRTSYKMAILRQFYKLVLHVEVFGNPVGLVKGLGAGVRDFLVLPARGLLESPEDFGRGIVNGSWSFVRGVVGAPSRTVSQVAGSLSRRVTAMSMDGAYISDHTRRGQDLRHHGPRHAVEGLRYGAEGFGRGMVEGVAGLLSQPIEGVQTQGIRGLVKGAGKGLVGLALKPTAGMLDFAQSTMEGFARTFEYIEDVRSHGRQHAEDDPHERLRLPRMLHGPAAAIYPYSADEAEARLVLQTLRDGVYLKEPLVLSIKLDCGQNTTPQILVITAGRMLLASVKDHRCTHHYPLNIISHVSQEIEGCKVVVSLRPAELQHRDGSKQTPPPPRPTRRVSVAAESSPRAKAPQCLASGSEPNEVPDERPADGSTSASDEPGSSTSLPPTKNRLSQQRHASSSSLFGLQSVLGSSRDAAAGMGSSMRRRGSIGARLQHAMLGISKEEPAMEYTLECGTSQRCSLIAEKLILVLSATEKGEPLRQPKRAMPGTSTAFLARIRSEEQQHGQIRRFTGGSTESIASLPQPSILFSENVPYLVPMESNVALLMEEHASPEGSMGRYTRGREQSSTGTSSPVWSVGSSPPFARLSPPFSRLGQGRSSENKDAHFMRPPSSRSAGTRRSIVPEPLRISPRPLSRGSSMGQGISQSSSAELMQDKNGSTRP